MRKRKKFAINKKSIIIIALILLILYWILGFIINVIKQLNLYTLEPSDYVDVNLTGKSLVVYDEYVINSYENTGIELKDNRIYSEGEEIAATINVDANAKSLNIDSFLTSLNLGLGFREKKSNDYTVNYNIGRENENENIVHTHNYQNLYSDLINKDIDKLNLTYLDDINQKNTRYNIEKVGSEDFYKNKSLVLTKPGILSSELDGYEDLISFDNIDKFNLSNVQFNFESYKMNGLKYVNNKRYYLIFQVRDMKTFDDFNLTNFDIEIENNKYKPSNVEVVKNIEGQTYLKILMSEGFKDIFGKRIVDTKINLTRLNALKVYNSSLIEKNGIKGVYKISNDIVKFTPVKVLLSKGDISFISTDINTIYSRAYLELVDDNNSMLNYDPNNPDYISILELKEFDKVIKNPNLVEEGDSY